MKTKLFNLASALICGAVLFSCTEEIENPIDNTVDDTTVQDYVITAYSEESSTKAELSSDKTILWQEGDEISVLSNITTNDKFVLTAGQQTVSGTFSGPLSNPGMSHVGVYPYNEGNAYGEIGSIVWGKHNQTATEGDFDPAACLMVGKLDDKGNISFKNICSYIKVETDFACTSIAITSKGNPLVSDYVLFTLDEDGVPANITPSGFLGENPKTVTLAGKSDEAGHTALIPAGTYYVAVLPQTYSGLTFTFNTEFGKTIDKTTKEGKNITINRNAIVNVGAFHLDDLLSGGSNDFYGSGTESDPYLISSLAKLQLLANKFADHENFPAYTKDTYFLQTQDIDCEGKEISIGSMRYDSDNSLVNVKQYYPFTGIYNGGGYTISNYSMKYEKDGVKYYAGLFNNIYQGKITNLTVAPATTSGDEVVNFPNSADAVYVGALIGYAGRNPKVTSSGEDADVSIIDCHLIGGPYKVSFPGSKAFGGLVGSTCGENLELKNCSNEASLSVVGENGYQNIVGGLVGMSTLASTSDIVSYAPHIVIDRCRNNGDISATGTDIPCHAGGLVGLHTNVWDNLEAHVSNSVNAGNVTASSTRTSNKYTDVSETSGPACAGGFFGFIGEDGSTSYFHNCLNKGAITAKAPSGFHARAGGFVGYSKEENNVSQGSQSGSEDHVYAALCVNTGAITGHTDNVGSFCGTVLGMKCIGCLWLDEHSYTDGKSAAIPYRAGVGNTADTSVDDYYYNTINPSMIVALLGTMMEHNSNSSFTNYASTLRWGTMHEWKDWAVAWTGEAVWNGSNTLDLDFSLPIAE